MNGEPAGDWRLRYVAARTRARRVLGSARLMGQWQAPPHAVLLDQVEAGAIEAAAAGLRRLPPPGGLSRSERLIWRRAAAAAEAAMRRAAQDRWPAVEPTSPTPE